MIHSLQQCRWHRSAAIRLLPQLRPLNTIARQSGPRNCEDKPGIYRVLLYPCFPGSIVRACQMELHDHGHTQAIIRTGHRTDRYLLHLLSCLVGTMEEPESYIKANGYIKGLSLSRGTLKSRQCFLQDKNPSNLVLALLNGPKSAMKSLALIRDALPRRKEIKQLRPRGWFGHKTSKACAELTSSPTFEQDSRSSSDALHEITKPAVGLSQQEDLRPSNAQTVSSRPPIFKLSQDLVIAITDYLPLHSSVLLSSTCRTLRQALVLHCDNKLSRLTRKEKWAFLAGMKEDLSVENVYICSACDRLHPIDTKDNPTQICHPHKCKPVPAALSMKMFSRNKPYLLYQRHIQLALHLWRTDPNSPHLASLLKPRAGWTLVDGFHTDSVVCAQIIDGSFILHTHRTINAEPDQFHWRTQQLGLTTHRPKFIICPHQKDLNDGTLVSGTQTTLLEHLLARLQLPGYHGAVSTNCNICGTDFEFWLRRGKFMTIRTWHDFGKSGEPADTMWFAQVRRTSQDHNFRANKQGRGARDRFAAWQKTLPLWSKHSGSLVSMMRLGLFSSERV